MKPLPITRALFTHPTIDPPSERLAGHYAIKTMLRRALSTSWQSWADGLMQSALLFLLSDGHPISLLVLTLSPIATTDYQPISQLPEFLDPNLFDPNPFDPVIALQRSFHGAAADHKNPAQRRVIKEHTPFHPYHCPPPPPWHINNTAASTPGGHTGNTAATSSTRSTRQRHRISSSHS